MGNKAIKYFFLFFFIFTVLFTIIFFGKNTVDASPPSTLNTGTLHKDGQILWGGQDRYYYYYEPNDPGSSPRPLVVLLHGGGINIDSFLGLDGKKAPFKLWLNIADEEKLYLAIPQGYQNHWNDCRGDCIHCGDEDDVGFLSEMINQLTHKYAIDTTRIYTTGESNGGLMSYRLAFELSDRIAAIAVMIAALPANNICDRPANPIPVLIMNGTSDKFIPWEGGQSINEGTGTFLSAYETVDFWVNFNNCDTIPESYDFPDGPYEDSSTVHRDIYNNGIQNTEVVLYRVEGGGHNSPSIEQQYADWFLKLAGLGAQNHDIEMSREVWNFFKRHTLAGIVDAVDSHDFSDMAFQLSQNYPNPFNPTTTIEYRLPRTAHLTMRIYNLTGQEVRTLVDEVQQPGVYRIQWDGKNSHGLDVSTGLYVVRMVAGDFVKSQKILLMK